MLREIFQNLFSTTSSRGRIEYAVIVVGLIAASTLFTAFGLAIHPNMYAAVPLLILGFIPRAALWFVAAQRIRDIGWNVPLVLLAMFIASTLSTYGGITQDGPFLVMGGPGAIAFAALLFLLAIMPGKTSGESKTAHVPG